MNANHLGNVLTTISDRKKRLAGTTPAFEAVIETAQDYYPFGSLMPGRKYNAGEYRFGFNGQEKDDEIAGVTGSHLDFGARIYDSRLGRWMSLDPAFKDYPDISNYAAFGLNPIYYIDPGGETLHVALQYQGIFIEDFNKTFGEEASILFEFDQDENLQLTEAGKKMLYMRTSLKVNEGDVMQGINKIITSEELTEVIYESNSNAEIKNPVTRDYFKANGKEIKVELDDLGGGATVTIWDAKNRFKDKDIEQNTVFVDTKLKSNKYGDKRHNTLFHELGHVLFQKNSQQESVIEFDNKARQEAGDEKRPVDDAHKNTLDPE